MPRRSSKTAAEYVPERPTQPTLRGAVQACSGCDLYAHATQAVFGEGPARSRVILVGEQPGNEEDLKGRPFVGPAGRLLDRALEEAGIERGQVYVTNAVKHFEFEERGKRRIHKKPGQGEIDACRPWLETEVAFLKPGLAAPASLRPVRWPSGIMPTVLRVFLCLAFASAAWCEPLDEAVHALAKKVSAQLAPSDGAQVTLRNLSKLSGGEAARARAILERSLRRSGSRPVEVLLTVSQSLQDVVLVAEFDRNGEHLVEMARYLPDAPPPSRRIALEKRLLFEQPVPILDVAEENGALLVLAPQAIVRYERSGTAWQRTGSKPLEGAPVLRDPRGRLQVSNGALVASLPEPLAGVLQRPRLKCDAKTPRALSNSMASRSNGWPDATPSNRRAGRLSSR